MLLWTVTLFAATLGPVVCPPPIALPPPTYLYKSKFNKLRYLTLRDDAFCEAYQEFREGNCIAKLTFCSPLDDAQVTKMRQILCGPKFNIEVQPPPHIQEPPAPPGAGPEGAAPPPNGENASKGPQLHPPHLVPGMMGPDLPPPFFMDVQPAQPNAFPWLGAIYSPDRKYICSGALVAPKTVITSAQCVAGAAPPPGPQGPGGSGEIPAGEETSGEQEAGKRRKRQPEGIGKFFVRFGRHHLNISSPYDKAYEYDVEAIEVAQNFDARTLESDFAILKLVSPVCHFPPVALPKKDDWENGHVFGAKAPVVYAGWGLGHYQAPYLRSLTSHLLPKDVCAKKFNWPNDQLSQNHLCVAPPLNVCIGGSGTPLVAYTPAACVLLGVMSLGDHCNSPSLPLLFTKVSGFIDDIEKYIDEDIRQMNGTGSFQECFLPPHKPDWARQPFYYYPSHLPQVAHEGEHVIAVPDMGVPVPEPEPHIDHAHSTIPHIGHSHMMMHHGHFPVSKVLPAIPDESHKIRFYKS